MSQVQIKPAGYFGGAFRVPLEPINLSLSLFLFPEKHSSLESTSVKKNNKK